MGCLLEGLQTTDEGALRLLRSEAGIEAPASGGQILESKVPVAPCGTASTRGHDG